MSDSTPKIFIIVRKEFLQGVRSRWFLMATFGLPLMISAIMGLTVAMTLMQSDEAIRLVVVDESKKVGALLPARFPDVLESGERKITFDNASINSLVEVERILQQLRDKVLAQEINGYLHLQKDFLDTGEVDFYALSVSNQELNARLDAELTGLRQELRLRGQGIDTGVVEKLMEPALLFTYRVTEEGAERDNLQILGLVYTLVLLLYLTVVLYGSSIGRSVLEEKVSRIVEVMLSSVRPFELLGGKVLGIGLVGLVQTTVWCLIGVVLYFFRQKFFGGLGATGQYVTQMPSIPLSIAFYFLIWFLLGYFLYALLYAMIASIVGSEQEAQQMQMPVSMLMLLPLISMAAFVQHPSSTFSVVMSMIPFFAPVVMFTRTVVLAPPLSHILLSMALTFATILALLWLTAKIYRIGILSHGKRPTLREVVKWVVYY